MGIPRNARIVLGLAVGLGLAALLVSADWRLPNDNQGYAPRQPIAYSHRVHAGELGLDCLYCHYGARTSRVAGIPPTGLCMNCHKVVTAGFDAVRAEQLQAEEQGREPRPIVSDKLRPLYDALGLDDDLQPVPGAVPRSVEWVAVHQLPDFVAFDHSVHVARGLACQTCHGPVQTMDRLRQESNLSMGWCVACHRATGKEPSIPSAPSGGVLPPDRHVSTDCSACHH